MKVAYFTALRRIELRDEPTPTIDQPEQVLVRIDRLGVCGSDVHYYAQGGIGLQRVAFPATLGHECAGTIVEVGSEVTRLKPGDRVAIDPAFACGTCDQCRVGRQHTCRNLRFMGCPGQAPGAAAELAVLPAANCLPVPDAVSLDMAVLAEPLSIGLHAVRLGEVYPAARIAILGSGPIGLSVLLCAKVQAPCTIYATDLLESRVELARQCGADLALNASQADAVATIAQHEPFGLDLVFECSGDPACMDHAAALLTPGGTLVQVGIPPAPRVEIDPHAFRVKELSVRNVRRQKGCVAPVIRMMAEGHIDAAPLVTHHFPLSQIGDAFELVADYRDGVVKAMVDVSGLPDA